MFCHDALVFLISRDPHYSPSLMFLYALMENKVVEEAKRRKKKYLIFKVDYEKTYDSVSLEFLLYVLKELGFQEKWIGWIRSCLVSSKMSVLFN